MQIRENVPISELTTMRLGGAARFVITLETSEDIPEAYKIAEEYKLPIWFMGNGANTIGRDEGYQGVILLNRIKGIFVHDGDNLIDINNYSRSPLPDTLKFTAMGGEVWDDFVKATCDLGYSGIEAMSLIPGTVGAAPVQNIGAYGQDVSQVIESVEVYDPQTQQIITLDKTEMRMSYRHTRFNHGEDAGRFFIISATFQLKHQNPAPPFYNSLQKYLNEHHIANYTPNTIRQAVCEIRQSKLPDPKFVASAGSFFKNITLTPEQADIAEAKGIPVWRNADGSGKINSGWLIEQCGFKGKIFHGIRVSEQAALVLINESAQSYADLDLARSEIIDTVAERFGYVLEQEPVEIVNP